MEDMSLYPVLLNQDSHLLEYGDMVFVGKYQKTERDDPYAIGFIDSVGKDRNGVFVTLVMNPHKRWYYFKDISKKEAEMIAKSKR